MKRQRPDPFHHPGWDENDFSWLSRQWLPGVWRLGHQEPQELSAKRLSEGRHHCWRMPPGY
ncbi:MAG: hypothetical protein OWR62_04785 [Sulfobacillus thermotolerans]|nr:hypothetical protein [Sulfobacillus thermotolerans]